MERGLLLEGSTPKIEDKQVPGIYISYPSSSGNYLHKGISTKARIVWKKSLKKHPTHGLNHGSSRFQPHLTSLNVVPAFVDMGRSLSVCATHFGTLKSLDLIISFLGIISFLDFFGLLGILRHPHFVEINGFGDIWANHCS